MQNQKKVESAQIQAQEEFDNSMGDILDSTKEQQESDCMDEGFHNNEKFAALDPDDYFEKNNYDYKENVSFYKKDFLSSEKRKLDPDQRRVVDLGGLYARNLKKSSSKTSTTTTLNPHFF